MKRQFVLSGLFAIIFLVIVSHGQDLPDTNVDLDDYDDSTPVVETITPAKLNDDPTNSTSTSTESTTASSSSSSSSSIISTTTTVDVTNSTTSTTTSTTTTTASQSTESTATSTSTTTSTTTSTVTTVTTTTTTTEATTTTQAPTTAAPGRKFDGLSFMGGMILAVGLGALLYLVVRYLRRSNRLPYSNLR